METLNEKNLSPSGFDETNDYTPPEMSEDVSGEDLAALDSQEEDDDLADDEEPELEPLEDEESDLITEDEEMEGDENLIADKDDQ